MKFWSVYWAKQFVVGKVFTTKRIVCQQFLIESTHCSLRGISIGALWLPWALQKREVCPTTIEHSSRFIGRDLMPSAVSEISTPPPGQSESNAIDQDFLWIALFSMPGRSVKNEHRRSLARCDIFSRLLAVSISIHLLRWQKFVLPTHILRDLQWRTPLALSWNIFSSRCRANISMPVWCVCWFKRIETWSVCFAGEELSLFDRQTWAWYLIDEYLIDFHGEHGKSLPASYFHLPRRSIWSFLLVSMEIES